MPLYNPASTAGGTPTEQTTTATGTQNDFDLDARYTLLRVNNASATTFTGFTVEGSAPQEGDTVVIENIAASAVKAAHQNTGSTEANRVICPSTAGQIIGAGGRMVCVYDATTDRWREHLVDAGVPINITFDAADFFGEGSMTWTVESGDVTLGYNYIQRGRYVQAVVIAVSTSVGGTLSDDLQWDFGGATGFTIASYQEFILYGRDAGSGNHISLRAYVYDVESTANVNFRRLDGANWATATNTTTVAANIDIFIS